MERFPYLRLTHRATPLYSRPSALALQALRALGAVPLPGPAPAWEEIRDRWTA
jgi:hypothetical protein